MYLEKLKDSKKPKNMNKAKVGIKCKQNAQTESKEFDGKMKNIKMNRKNKNHNTKNKKKKKKKLIR